MNWVDKLTARTWSILVISVLAFAISGCEGSDGAAGATGATGATGAAGPPGADGPPGPAPDDVEAAIANADVESCSVCHAGAGDYHQAEYNKYTDPSDLVLVIDDVLSSDNGDGTFDLTVEFTATKDGQPIADLAAFNALNQKRFIAADYDGAGQYFNGGQYFGTWALGAGPGEFTGVKAAAPFDPTVNGFVYGYIADEEWTPADAQPTHIHLYDNVASAALAFGSAVDGAAGSYETVANSSGCTNCHGAPYMKHGYRASDVAGIPEFAACKTCHYDDRNGGHTEWQYMADEPFNWATGVAETADYSYTANIMNDTHMSHAMEFPYPMSMSSCVTCHEGKLTTVLDDSYFTPQTCKSCHVVQGLDAWPEDAGGTLEGMYAQPHRPPPLEFLWARAGVEQFHSANANCQACHAPPLGGGAAAASLFADYHSGYDKTVYNANGTPYTDLADIAIDNVTIAGDLITVNFSSFDATVNPTLAISFYGWDSKHFIVPAHERDANGTDCPHNSRPGCNIEWEPGSTKPFFTEEAGSIAGDWQVTFDMSGFQAYKTDPIPTLIADGIVKFAEITIIPELEVGGVDVNVDAVSTTFDLGGSLIVDDYFQGAGDTVDIEKCGACHENTGVLVHTGAGRYGDSMQTCKACHNPTFDGSHMEMQSRSIDSYVHAIHRFQPLDEDDVYNANDPVFTERNNLHKGHVFPTFTILSCEACHVAGTYNVPDQSMSMPGAQSASYDLNDPSARAIGTIPMSVTGAAGRACGSCHRASLIVHDEAGDLASFDAHTDAFGTFEENDDDDLVLFGIIDKIMSMFE